LLKYIAKRVATGLILIWVVSFVTFLLLHLGSGNVASNILGINTDPTALSRLNHELGVDQPFFTRYGHWLWNAIHLNLGNSWAFPGPVTANIAPKLRVTLTIVSVAMLVIIFFSLILGITAALVGGWMDRFLQFLSVIGFAFPGFLVAVVLVDVFALHLHLFNATGYVSFADDPLQWFKSVTLPIFGLSLAGIANLSQQVRGSVKDVLETDYIRTLRARGFSEFRVIVIHALRNSAAPALAVLGLYFEGLIGSAVIVERMFAIPGIGTFGIQAVTATDFPSVMGFVMLIAAIIIITNLLVDITVAALNPKIRLT
jgi:peptide/nickel transport system permease protein